MRATAMVWLLCALIWAAVAIVTVRRAAAETPPASRPNVVLIVSDDQTMDSLAAMPFLMSRPGGHWVEFTNAFVNTPWCCPTRATLFSGLYSHHHGVVESNGEAFDESSTLATWLRSAGYRTGLAGKYLNDYPYGQPPYIPPGWSDWFANVDRTQHYNYEMNDNGAIVFYGNAASDYQTDVVARRADAFIRSSNGQPFFFYAAPVAPHIPLTPPPRYVNTPVTVTRPPNFNEFDVSDKPAWVQQTALLSTKDAGLMDKNRAKEFRMVMAVDDLIRTVYQALADTGVLENTVIIFQTDNGYMFGEHRQTEKTCAYEECVRTPLFMRVPWVEGHTEPKLLSSVDIAPTISEFAGVVPGEPVDGLSAARLVDDVGSVWRSSVLLEFAGTTDHPRFWAVRSQQWKYVELETGERELYDMVADPYELQNVAGLPAHAALQAELTAELESLRTAPPHLVLPSVSVADLEVAEGTGSPSTAQFSLRLSAASPASVSVRATTLDGTATSPDDYQARSQIVTFAPGELVQSFSVPISPDATPEMDESFSVTLDQPDGADIFDGQAVGTIIDDDDGGLPTLSVGDATVVEGDAGSTAATFTVSLIPSSSEPVSVSYQTVDDSAVSPEDYETTSGPLTFEPGESSKVVTVNVAGDEVAETDEAFLVELSQPAGALLGDATGVGSIVDDDTPPQSSAASIGDVTVNEGNSGSTPAAFTVSLSPPPQSHVEVSWATVDGSASSAADYEAASGLLAFEAGEWSKVIGVPVLGDALHEATESFFVEITSSDATIADGQGAGVIANDDAPPTVSISDVTIVEGTGGSSSAVFVVSLSAPSGLGASVSYTTLDGSAKAPGDYLAAAGTLGFSPGQTTSVVPVSIVGDTLSERAEVFTLALSNPVGATIADGSGRCVIQNDD